MSALQLFGINKNGFNTEVFPLKRYGVNCSADMFQQMNERVSVLGVLIFIIN